MRLKRGGGVPDANINHAQSSLDSMRVLEYSFLDTLSKSKHCRLFVSFWHAIAAFVYSFWYA